MSRPTINNCADCNELFPDVAGQEVRCTAWFRPRCYDDGFKRRCSAFAPSDDADQTRAALSFMGYRCYEKETRG